MKVDTLFNIAQDGTVFAEFLHCKVAPLHLFDIICEVPGRGDAYALGGAYDGASNSAWIFRQP